MGRRRTGRRTDGMDRRGTDDGRESKRDERRNDGMMDTLTVERCAGRVAGCRTDSAFVRCLDRIQGKGTSIDQICARACACALACIIVGDDIGCGDHSPFLVCKKKKRKSSWTVDKKLGNGVATCYTFPL